MKKKKINNFSNSNRSYKEINENIVFTYLVAYENVNGLRLMGAKDRSLDQPYAWSKIAHAENVEASLCAFLHKELYRYARQADPQLYLPIISTFLNKCKYMTCVVEPVPLGNKNKPIKSII